VPVSVGHQDLSGKGGNTVGPGQRGQWHGAGVQACRLVPIKDTAVTDVDNEVLAVVVVGPQAQLRAGNSCCRGAPPSVRAPRTCAPAGAKNRGVEAGVNLVCPHNRGSAVACI
jgi:hypothetical protein